LTVALRSYTKEGAPSWGRSHASMSATLKAAQTGVSAREYDQQLREVAAYFASLPTELKVIPESRFR
jgi:hypothetical protein